MGEWGGHVGARDSTVFHPHLQGMRQNPHFGGTHFPNCDARAAGTPELMGQPVRDLGWVKTTTYRVDYTAPRVKRQPRTMSEGNNRFNGERAQEQMPPGVGGVPSALFSRGNPLHRGTEGDVWSRSAYSSTYRDHFSEPGGVDFTARYAHANEVKNLLHRKDAGADPGGVPRDMQRQGGFSPWQGGKPMLIKHSHYKDHYHGFTSEPARPAVHVSLPDAHGPDVHMSFTPKAGTSSALRMTSSPVLGGGRLGSAIGGGGGLGSSFGDSGGLGSVINGGGGEHPID